MIHFTSLDSISLRKFPAAIHENKSIEPTLKLAVRYLRVRWFDLVDFTTEQFYGSASWLKGQIQDVHGQEELIKHLAQKTNYLTQEIAWNKTCTGHEFQINNDPKKESKVKEWIDKYKRKYFSNPEVDTNRTQVHKESKGKKKYVGRFELFHHDNARSCSSTSSITTEVKTVNLARFFHEVLDPYILEKELSSEDVYMTLFNLITDIS